MSWTTWLFRRSDRRPSAKVRARSLRVESLEHREVPASLAGNVFRDFDNSGALNGPDAAISGVTVTLTGGGLTSPKTATTDTSGNFSFTALAAGTYTLTATAPTGTAAGKTTAGNAAGTAGTSNIISGITLTDTQDGTGYKFGQVPNALTTGGKVFDDTNGNGTQDTGEKGIAGVTVTLSGTSVLTGAAITPKTATTGADGTYSFTALTAGTYNITHTPKTGFTVGTLTNGTPAATSTANGAFTGIDLTSTSATSTGFNFADLKPITLSLEQSLSDTRVKSGEQVEITFVAKNTSGRSAASVAASINLGGLTFTSVSGTGFDSTTNEWSIGTLAGGASATLTITATVPSRGLFVPASRLVSTDSTLGIVGDTAFSTVNANPFSFSLKNFLANSFAVRNRPVVGTPSFPTAPTGGGTNNDTPITPTVALYNAAGTSILTSNFTTDPTTVIKGITSPNTALTLVETGATTTSDSSGNYTFTNVPVASGNNTYTVKATATGGGTSQATGTVTGNSAPTISNQQADVALNSTTTNKVIDLAGKFTDANLGTTKVKFTTSLGDVNIDLFDKQAPQTVANFLNYVTSGKYNNSIFHRSVSNFVLQGGGFGFNGTGTPSITTIPTDPAVQNEPDSVNRSNLRGTIAMAKLGGDPNSATDQFFFNLANNASNLDNQNGGFTVFAKVSSPADQTVVDALAAIPTQNKSTASALPPSQQGVFDNIPLRNYTGANFPTDTTINNYAAITGASIVSQPEALTYSVVSNSNSAAVTATIVNNRLTVTKVTGQTGSATITVRATDKGGLTKDMTFTVTAS